MNILFLHLSDIHIENRADLNTPHITKIVDSLSVIDNFNKVVIIVSGDIANGGKREQYEYSRFFFGQLISQIKVKYKLNIKPDMIIVPGNHDYDLDKGDLGYTKIQELYTKKRYDEKISQETGKLDNFFNFAKGNLCFDNGDLLFHRRLIDFDGFVIEFNCLNSALFTSRDNVKGLHYLPSHTIMRIAEPSNAAFVVSVMHHSHHWFIDEVKNELEHILFEKSSLVFYGHEHILENQNISLNSTPSVQVLAGGELSNKGNWENSQYYAGILDSDRLNFTLYEFCWNKENQIYVHKQIKEELLPSKPSIDNRLIPQASFLKELRTDEKHQIANDFNEYFVFPRIQREERTDKSSSIDIVDESVFISEVERRKNIIIVGFDNSGKTILLKRLFLDFSKRKYVLYCNINRIVSGNRKRVIKRMFEDIYGDSPIDYERFLQHPKSDKMLIIDDIHMIEHSYFNAFMNGIEDEFDYVIFSTKNVLELNVMDRFKRLMDDNGSYYRYRIQPYYNDKRNELINKIVCCKIPNDSENQKRTSYLLTESIKNQRSLFNLDPEFIIQYTEYYCNNVKEAAQNDGDIFSKVFEANIVNQISPLLKKITVDKVFIILDKIAYYIHINKAYPIKQNEIAIVISKYNEDYDKDVDIAEFIKLIIESKVIARCDDKPIFKFCSKNYLAYFVAREIRRRYLEDNETEELERILKFSCFDINENILLFLTYITENPNLLRIILARATEIASEWPEFSLDNENIPYLSSVNLKPLKIAGPESVSGDSEIHDEIEQEKIDIKKSKIDTIDVYNYKEEDVDKLFHQICRALAILNTVARCLPNFEHMMLKHDISRFVDVIYRLPNKIFYMWANDVENNKDELIEIIKKLKENDYSRERDFTDEDAMRLLQWDSMSLLLDVYNIASLYSTKEHTEKYLSAFGYETSTTYSLQHLMILEMRNKISQFIKESAEIYDKKDSIITDTLVMRIARHVLVHSKTIKHNEIEQLLGKYFSSATDRQRLLYQRAQSTRKL